MLLKKVGIVMHVCQVINDECGHWRGLLCREIGRTARRDNMPFFSHKALQTD